MNIYERINKEVGANPDAPTEAIVTDIARMCSKQDLLPLLAAAVDNAKRQHVRSEEQKHLSHLMDAMRPTLLPSVPKYDPSAFQSFLARAIKLGDGTTTTWGLATTEEHRKRLSMLMAQRNGLSETIRRHEEAIRLLEETGAPCLAALAVEERAA